MSLILFPAESILRHARCSFNRDGSTDLYEVYRADTGCFEVPPFQVKKKPFPERNVILFFHIFPRVLFPSSTTFPGSACGCGLHQSNF